MKISESKSGWRFSDLLIKTARELSEEDFKTYSNPNKVMEERLIKFLERLPNGDYTETLSAFWQRGYSDRIWNPKKE